MLTAHCPRCRETVRVPDAVADAPQGTQVQCPWCLATLEATEIVASLPPAVVVLGGSTLPGPIGSSSSAGVESERLQSVGLGAATGTSGAAAVATAAAGGVAAAGGAAMGLLGSDDEQSNLDETNADDLDFIDEDTNQTVSDSLEMSSMETVEDLEPVALADLDDDVEDITGLDDQLSPSIDSATESTVDFGAALDAADNSETAGVASNETPEIAPMMDISTTKRRRSSGGLMSVLPIALGGLTALPIVGGILLFLGKAPNLGFYPFDGSFNQSATRRVAAAPRPDLPGSPPTISTPAQGRSLAADMTPDQLMADAAAQTQSALDEITGDTSAESTPGLAPTDLGSDAASADSTPPAALEPNALEPGATTDAGTMTLPVDDSPLPTQPDSPMALPDAELPGADLPSAVSEAPETTTDNRRATEEPEAAPENPPARSPAVDERAINAQVDQVLSLLDKVANTPADDPKRASGIQFTFANMAKLAALPGSSQSDDVRELLARVASDKTLATAFAKMTPDWMATSAEQRQTDGALVVGKLSGDLANATILLPRGQSVPVTLPEELESIPGGIQVGLGTIVGQGDQVSLDLAMLETFNPQ